MEALLRQSLSEYTLPVEEQDWQDFLTYAAKKKSRRGGIWWALALAILCCTGLLAYQMVQVNPIQETSHSLPLTSSPSETVNSSDAASTSSSPKEVTTEAMTSAEIQSPENQPSPELNSGSSDQASRTISRNSSTPSSAKPSTSEPASPRAGSQGILDNSRISDHSLANEKISIEAIFGMQASIDVNDPELDLDPWPNKAKKKKDQRPGFPINTTSIYFSYSQVLGRSGWSVENGGQEYVHRQLAAALSNNSMSISGNGFEAGFRMPISSRPVLRNLSISGGFEYATRIQTSNFSFYSSEFPVIDTADRITAYIPDTIPTLNEVNLKQQHNSFSLPIQIQMAKNINNNLNLGIRAGLQVSYFQSTNQEQIDPLTFEATNKQKPLKSVNLSYTAGLFAEYRIKRDWGLMLSIDRRYYRPIYQSGEYLNNQPKIFDTRFSIIRYL